MTFALVNIAVAVVTFSVAWALCSYLKSFLIRRTGELEAQAELIDEIQDLAASFLRKVDGKDTEILINAIANFPNVVCDRRIAKFVLFSPVDQREGDAERKRVHAVIDTLSPEMQDLLGKITGRTLIAATYSFPLIGGIIRRSLFSSMDKQEKSTSAPEQTIMTLNWSSERAQKQHKHLVAV